MVRLRGKKTTKVYILSNIAIAHQRSLQQCVEICQQAHDAHHEQY